MLIAGGFCLDAICDRAEDLHGNCVAQVFAAAVELSRIDCLRR